MNSTKNIIGFIIAIFAVVVLVFFWPSKKASLTNIPKLNTTLNTPSNSISTTPVDDGLDKLPKVTITDFTLPKYDDSSSITLSTFYNDKPTIIQFWATWCEICRREFPINNNIVSKYKDKVHYIAVDWAQGDKKAVADYIQEHKLDPSVITFVMDADGTVGVQYGVRGTPMHVFIKKGGDVLLKQSGELNPQGFEYLVKKLIQ